MIHQDLHSFGNTQQSFSFTAPIPHKIRAPWKAEIPGKAQLSCWDTSQWGRSCFSQGAATKIAHFPQPHGKKTGVCSHGKPQTWDPLTPFRTKTKPGLGAAAPSPKGNLLGFVKEQEKWPKSSQKVEYLCSLVPISSAESSPGLKGFSWQALDCTRLDLLARGGEILGYQSLARICKQRLDCLCLSGMIYKAALRWECRKKNIWLFDLGSSLSFL